MLKDQKLDEIVQRGGNVAQFVSFGPDGKKRYSRIRNTSPTHRFSSVERAIQAVLDTGTRFVNIRSFTPSKPDGNPFFMGRKEQWKSLADIADQVRSLVRKGLYVIVNEDIPVDDGGFSGVMSGEIAEFAPSDTPRCVEKPGCATLSRHSMLNLVRAVYDRRIGFPYSRDHRVEFSVSPGPVGYLLQPHVVWQEEQLEHGVGPQATQPQWPNRYSEAMGDKAYGLLMAHLFGLRVPRTRVTGRIIPPFTFGEETLSEDRPWIRTCPRVQQPGQFTTEHGWIDPFALMHREDADASRIASIMEQDAVDAVFSGAAITDSTGQLIIEGTAGAGDKFMVGEATAVPLPKHVLDAITSQWERASAMFGFVRFEWVYDTKNTLWLVQLHCGKSDSCGSVIYPGDAERWVRYPTALGLEKLRGVVREIKKGEGVVLVGDVGITSHFGDHLRRAKIPSRLERS